MSLSHVFGASAPYPGLRPFDAEESDIFFGRETQTDEILTRLQRVRFLAILGPSGCGKSSLIGAGIVSALQIGFMSDAGSRWRVAWMRPADNPIRRLADSLIEAGNRGGSDNSRADTTGFIEAALRRGPLGLIEVIEESGLVRDANLLLVVDQFEEVFRFRAHGDLDEADAFVALLLAAVRQSSLPIYVILTMRSDFLGDCSLFHELPEAINESAYLIPRLTRDQCSLAITGPSRVFDGAVEPLLVNRLLNDFGRDPDQLPRLQHALMRMWQRRSAAVAGTAEPVVLTVDDYEAVGGFAQALSDHADEALSELTQDQQRIVKRIFQRLTERGVGKRDTRAPARFSELARVAGIGPADATAMADLRALVDAFRRPDRSFLTPREGPVDDDTLIDIGHESLIRQWKALAQWVDEEAESAIVYARLRDTARLWEAGEAGLWRNPDLERASLWRNRAQPTEAWAARYGTPGDFALAMTFLDASAREQKAREAEAEAARRQSLRSARRFGMLVTLLVLATVGSLAYYLALVREHAAYFNDFTKVRGVPHGIGRLTLAQVHHRATSMKLVTKGFFGPVLRLEAINSREEPTTKHQVQSYLDDEADTTENTPVRWEFGSDERGQVLQETAYNRRGERVSILMYSAGSADQRVRNGYYVDPSRLPTMGGRHSSTYVEIEYSPQGYESVIRYRGRYHNPKAARNTAFGERRIYDDRGAIIEATSIGPNDAPMNDTAGNAGVHLTLDSLGNQIEVLSFDASGAVAPVNEGWARTRSRYDENGNLLEIRYFDGADKPTWHRDGYHRASLSHDQHGNRDGVAYWDVDGRPSIDPNGCHEYRFAHDGRDNVVRDTCIGTDGKLSSNIEGVTVTTFRYDARDRLIEVAYFGRDGRPINTTAGYSITRFAYDPHGNRTQWTRYGEHEEPVSTKQGYWRIAVDYDSANNEISRTYYDTANCPVPGSASRKRTYDDYGNKVEETWYGADGKPWIDREGYASQRTKCDADGRETEIAYAGVRGEPVLSRNGYAAMRRQYDVLGHVIRTDFLDRAGKPTLSNRGIAGWKAAYDAHGNEIARTNLGLDGRPAISSDGWAEWRATYDVRGNPLDVEYYDARGERILVPWPTGQRVSGGYWRWSRRYNVQNRVIEEAYFGIRGEPVSHTEGWSRKVNRYTAGRSEPVETAYFGVRGEPAISADGYHKVRHTLDDYGRAVETVYLYADDRPVNVRRGFGRLKTKYDRYGHIVEDAFFDADGTPASNTDGAHRLTIRYDGQGRMTDAFAFAANGRPATTLDGYHQVHVTYDDRGNTVERAYFAIDGKAVLHRESGAAISRHRYDERDNEVEALSYGTDGKPIAGRPRITAAYDLRNRRIAVAYYDAQRRLVPNAFGYAVERDTYDSRGNPTSRAYFGADGRPAVRIARDENIGGFASSRTKYDDRGNALEVTYWDTRGERVACSLGYWRVLKRYGVRRQVLEESTFGTDGKPVNVSGYARVVGKYDGHGNLIAQRVFDASGKPALIASQYHVYAAKYDAHDNLTEAVFFNERGESIGCGKWLYDANDNQIEKIFCDKDGNERPSADGDVRVQWAYDSHRRVIEERHIGSSNRVLRITRYFYDRRGNKTAISHRDANGRPILGPDKSGRSRCTDWTAQYDAAGNIISSKCRQQQ